MAIGFIFPVSQVPEGETEHNFSGTPKSIELEYRDVGFHRNVSFRTVCDRRGNNVFCIGKVTTEVELTCSRCLKRFIYEVCEEFEFNVKLRRGEPVVAKLWEDDTVSVDLRNGAVDLSMRIRDAVILAIPPYPLCDVDCKGLCSICGADLNEGNCEHHNKD